MIPDKLAPYEANPAYNDTITCPRCETKSYYSKKKHVRRLIACGLCGWRLQLGAPEKE